MYLHHYEHSPFSEKIRLMFGYCGMHWYSVLSPSVPPRPNLDPLTGGYRKIPVAQQGADIFCDTRIISSEIAQLQNKPLLAQENCAKEVVTFVEKTDLELFLAVVAGASPMQKVKALLRNHSISESARFVRDRLNMMKGASIGLPSAPRARKQLNAHYSQLESKLNETTFLFGEEPCIADFSAYHTLWMRQLGGETAYPRALTNIDRWYQRMAAWGHGDREDVSAKQAFVAAQTSTPRALPETTVEDRNLGRDVAVRPADYGRDKVVGVLVASTKQRWIIARHTHEFGVLHVHFPKQGFAMSRV